MILLLQSEWENGKAFNVCAYVNAFIYFKHMQPKRQGFFLHAIQSQRLSSFLSYSSCLTTSLQQSLSLLHVHSPHIQMLQNSCYIYSTQVWTGLDGFFFYLILQYGIPFVFRLLRSVLLCETWLNQFLCSIRSSELAMSSGAIIMCCKVTFSPFDGMNLHLNRKIHRNLLENY